MPLTVTELARAAGASRRTPAVLRIHRGYWRGPAGTAGNYRAYTQPTRSALGGFCVYRGDAGVPLADIRSIWTLSPSDAAGVLRRRMAWS